MKKTLSLILSLILVLTSLCSTSVLALADDAREVVSTVAAESNISSVAVYAGSISEVSFNVTEGVQAHFEEQMHAWYVKKDGNWSRLNSGVFRAGTYRFEIQLRVDGKYGTTHRITKDASVTVDGVKWDIVSDLYGEGSKYSYIYVRSPEITIDKVDMPLTFSDSDNLDIRENYVNNTIASFSLENFVIGGEEPYVFSKTSGPEFISVSESGTVSGTPTAAGSNASLVVRVTDAKKAYKEITIAVGNTYPDPADREIVEKVTATSNISDIAVYGNDISQLSFNVTDGTQAHFEEHMFTWRVKNGDNWETASGTFTHGVYCFDVQLRVDGKDGNTHQITNDADVTVDGTKWTVKPESHGEGPNYSYIYVRSPEIEIHNIVSDKAVAPTFKNTGKTAGTHCSVCGKIFSGNKTVAKLVSPTITKLTAGKKSFTAQWKKAPTVAGYQIQYAANAKFTKGKKTVTVKSANTVKKAFKKLGSKKKYYVRVRAYKKINGKTVYSSWSKSKAVKTK